MGSTNFLPPEFQVSFPTSTLRPLSLLWDAEEGTRAEIAYLSSVSEARAALSGKTRGLGLRRNESQDPPPEPGARRRPSSETCLERSPSALRLWGTLSAAPRFGAVSLWPAESCAAGLLQPRGAPESDRSPHRASFLGTVGGGRSGWPSSRGPALTCHHQPLDQRTRRAQHPRLRGLSRCA